MAFWNTHSLQSRGPKIIEPFDGGRIKHSAYELAVGNEYFSTSMQDGKQVLVSGKQIKIEPGQLALLITQETIRLPQKQIGLISMKFKYKRKGLINVSGFHVDPGYSGRLKFSVYNAGSKPAIFDIGQTLFQMWICDLVGESDIYDGEHKDQQEINSGDVSDLLGDVASPQQLKNEISAVSRGLGDRIAESSRDLKIEIDRLATQVKWLWAAATLVLVVFFSPLIASWFERHPASEKHSTTPAGQPATAPVVPSEKENVKKTIND